MADDSDLERTESPSAKRLEKAREQGQVARSRELTTFALLGGAGAALTGFGPHLAEVFLSGMRSGLTVSREDAFSSAAMASKLYTASLNALLATLPVLGITALAAIGATIALGGFLFTTQALAPNFSRINPASGLARMVSTDGLVELLKALLKSAVLIGLAAWLILRSRNEMLALAPVGIEAGIHEIIRLLTHDYFLLCGGLALIAVADAPYQLFKHHSKLKMSRQELRDEARESEGDPHVKGRIRRLQRESARRRMMAKVPKADVVVVNPTHYSVAIAYDESMRAPRVLAKGVALTALKIRELAKEHNVPVLEAPPLARALYAHTALDAEIPVPLYEAVALVMAYVYQLRTARAAGAAMPERPSGLPVPVELDPLHAAEPVGDDA